MAAIRILPLLLFLLGALALPAAAAQQASSHKEVEALKLEVARSGDAAALAWLVTMSETTPSALAALGDLYSRDSVLPADGAKAADYYERALAAGDKGVQTRLGLLYRDGKLLPAKPARALELLSSAAEAGDRWAMFHLAQGHLRKQFGAASRPAEGVKMLERAMAAGNPQAVVALSNLYMWGNGGLRRDSKQAVKLLEDAAHAGNPVAARSLIAIYRDGRSKRVPRNPKKATALLAEYGKLFDAKALAAEHLLMDGVAANTTARRRAVADQFAKAEPAVQCDFSWNEDPV
jgi:TPR repeat protein